MGGRLGTIGGTVCVMGCTAAVSGPLASDGAGGGAEVVPLGRETVGGELVVG